jgi:hypothetical protein
MVVMQNAAIRQHKIGDKVSVASHSLHRQVGNWGINMRYQVKPRRPGPETLHANLCKIVGDQLRDLRPTSDAGDELEINLNLFQHPFASIEIAACAFVLVSHGARGDALPGVV